LSTPQFKAKWYTSKVISKIEIETSPRKQLIDITSEIEKALYASKSKEGQVLVFAKHTTCSVIICEIEDDLEEDFLKYLEKEGPKGPFVHSHGGFYAHDPVHAGKSHTPAHLLSAMIGCGVTIPISENKLQLGTWQRICLLELDGPRKREIVISFIS